MFANIVLSFIYLALIGWVVYQLMGQGNHGIGLLHYAFVGGGGCCVAELLQRVTGLYTTGLWSTIGVSVICAMLVEFAIRRARQYFLTRIDD